MNGKITYSYTPPEWSQERFLSLGGFVVVFPNFNKMPWIRRGVASALSQDYPLLEMFFMDNASTDGSGDEMERIVREYRGRHKVFVVRNSENVHIAGQWNIASKLASGNWLGMFCGDDVSHPDRIGKIAERLRQYPMALGICTASRHFDYKTGHDLGLAHYGEKPYVLTGDEQDYRRIEKDIDGATSFYHKSLFDIPLSKAPLDDYLLRWVVMRHRRGNPDVAWVVACDLVTVDYTKGSGLTSAELPDDGKRSSSAQWIADERHVRGFSAVAAKSRLKIIEYMNEAGNATGKRAPIRDMAYLEFCRIHSSILSGTTFSRLVLLPSVMSLMFSHALAGQFKKELAACWLKRLILEFFGLKVASLIAPLIHQRKEGNSHQ